MTLKLAEQLATDLVALLQAQIPAKVAALNLRYGDSLLTAPRTDAYHTSAKVFERTPEFPSVFVLARGFAFRSYSPTNGPNIVEERVQIWWVDVHQDPEKLQKKLARWAVGTIEIVAANHAVGGLSGGAQLGGGKPIECDLSATAPNGEEYIADCKLDLTFTASETFA